MYVTLRAAVVHATLTGSLSASGVRERYKALLKRRSQGGGDVAPCVAALRHRSCLLVS